MPALDTLIGGGAIHIADQNKQKPIKTLCGQALDKDSTRYFMDRENFAQATCKVCRGIYFDETWTGEARTQETQPPVAQIEQKAIEPVVEKTPVVGPQDGALPPETKPEEQEQEHPAPRTTLFGGLVKPVNSKQEASDGPERS
jgi:hypothetical protein